MKKVSTDILDRTYHNINLQRMLVSLIGVGINVGLGFLMYHFELPLYLDVIGTIVVSALTGVLWGMFTAVSTSLISVLFNPLSVYYTIIQVVISLFTVAFIHYPRVHRKRFIPVYIAVLGLIGGGAGMGIHWALTGGPSFKDVAELSQTVTGENSVTYVLLCLVICVGLDIVDKVLSVALAFVLAHLIPKKMRRRMWDCNWRQKPLSDEEQYTYKKETKTRKTRMGHRILILMLMTALFLITAQSIITMNLYVETVNKDYADAATKAASFAAETVNGDMVEAYLMSTETIGTCSLPGYRDTMAVLDRACRSINGISYIYVYRIEKDGIRTIFDTDPEGAADTLGEEFEMDEAYLPYKEDLLAGKEVPVVESDDEYGHLITAYAPVYNSAGEVVAYAGADATYTDIGDYTRTYATRLALILSGFFVMILSCGLWLTRYVMVRPVMALAHRTDSFVVDDVDQKTLDQKVKEFREIRVQTGDEIEFLYDALCRMMSAVAEQMRELRHYTEATAQMQNGLIITMADMVESRDSDTGAHIQKTAAYVKIILEGLKKKGYYAEKLTPKYMSDAVISAPLHDVGKINVPDAVLNKPGKLTPEEYEIIKTHTTAGREIIERAIDTVHGENYLKEARNMAAYHHERWDGKGYPEGLHGEVIPLSARVMAVADVFDALTSKRVYKPAFPLEKAIEIIEEGAGTQFDPKCVEVFVDSLTEVKIILKKYNEM